MTHSSDAIHERIPDNRWSDPVTVNLEREYALETVTLDSGRDVIPVPELFSNVEIDRMLDPMLDPILDARRQLRRLGISLGGH